MTLNSDSVETIHELVRKNDYQKAYDLALILEKERGALTISFTAARLLTSVIVFSYLVFGFQGVDAIKKLILFFIRNKKFNWEQANGILWGVYWQDMRKALKYNILTMALAKDESSFLTSLAFLFYTESFFGNLFSLRAMTKLVHSPCSELAGVKPSLLVWLGVANQMNAKVDDCISAHTEFSRISVNPSPFQVLISKASLLNLSVSELGPLEAELALEECFKVSCSLNNSRNHIQLYGAKSILLALSGDHKSAHAFHEKSKYAAEVNSNTLDWIIFSRISCMYFLLIKNWEEFDYWHEKMCSNLLKYAPIAWYWKEAKRYQVLAIYEKNKRKISFSLCVALLNSVIVFQPYFFKSSLKTLLRYVFFNELGLWTYKVLLAYFKRHSSYENSDGKHSVHMFQSLALSVSHLLSKTNDSQTIQEGIYDLAGRLGSDYVIMKDSLQELKEKAAQDLGFDLEKIIIKENENQLRFFIHNKGFFIAHEVIPKSHLKPFAYGMLFRVLDVHALEAFDLISRLTIQYLTALDSAKKNAYLVAEAKILNEKANFALQIAHDIRSPLTALVSVSQSLNDLHKDQKELLNFSAQRINTIANLLLKKAKDFKPKNQESFLIETNSESEKNHHVLLRDVLYPILQEKRVQIAHLQISIKVTGHIDGIVINIDRRKFERVLSNLLHNAIEAINDKTGTIEVRVSKRSSQVIVEIIDNGIGMSDEVLEKLGRPGFTYGKPEGSGLGVHHAFQTIQSFNGEISYISQVGVGTLVQVLLPMQNEL